METENRISNTDEQTPKKIFWKKLYSDLKDVGYQKRTTSTLMKEFDETIAMIQMQSSSYDSVTYYINMTCVVKALNNIKKPLFDRDGMNFVRIQENDYNKIIEEVLFYTKAFSSINSLREITLNDKALYNSSYIALRTFLGIEP